MPISLFDGNTALLLVGLVSLVITLIAGAIGLRGERVHTGWVSVALVLVACALITIGSVRIAFAPSPLTGSANVSTPADPAGADVGIKNTSSPNSLGISDGAPRSTVTLQSLGTQYMPLVVASAGGLLILIGGLALYFRERRKPGFESNQSSGLVHVGAGAFVLVATLAIPAIPLQWAGVKVTANGAVSAAPALPTVRRVSLAGQTPTATLTLTPSGTPSPVPSLTPTESETPIVLFTSIPYTSTYMVGIQGVCTATANTLINLRGDPSVDQPGIGRVLAGSLLNVTGRSPNKKWWRVIYTEGTLSIEGWVSAAYVTADATCTDQVVPVVGASANSPAAPTNTLSPSQVAPVASSPTQAAVSGSANSGSAGDGNVMTVAPCTLLTTMLANIRPDPSRLHSPLGSVPEKSVLLASGRSSDGQWWHVPYGSQDGWINTGAVIASASCASAPVVSTPAF
ncbi:MAG TPA: SH3 domain-containing protein [Aggregatilineaceae bacterium]|nr:SH3 domain-containing protein [Aggregatilineaceae bacterium]